MNAFIEATKWPMGFEPDDTTSLLQCTIINERTSVEASVGQHVHQTGQFVVALSGLVGLALGRNRVAFPPSSAAWVPPGCRLGADMKGSLEKAPSRSIASSIRNGLRCFRMSPTVCCSHRW